MNGKPIKSFRELSVYQKACELDLLIFRETKSWPKEERYSLIDQVRRSSRSIGANLAEAWAKRRYPAHFLSKLSDADGELQETMHWLERASEYGYLSSEQCIEMIEICKLIGAMLGKMLQMPDSFS